MRDPREHIAFLFELIKSGYLDIKPLSHGLQSLCYEMINNDYTRYERVMNNLCSELRDMKLPKNSSQQYANYFVGYKQSLTEAWTVVTFWKRMSLMFYSGEKYAVLTERILPNARKLIISNPGGGQQRKKYKLNPKGSKGPKT